MHCLSKCNNQQYILGKAGKSQKTTDSISLPVLLTPFCGKRVNEKATHKETVARLLSARFGTARAAQGDLEGPYFCQAKP